MMMPVNTIIRYDCTCYSHALIKLVVVVVDINWSQGVNWTREIRKYIRRSLRNSGERHKSSNFGITTKQTGVYLYGFTDKKRNPSTPITDRDQKQVERSRAWPGTYSRSPPKVRSFLLVSAKADSENVIIT